MVYGKTPFQHIQRKALKVAAITDGSQIPFPDIENKDLLDTIKVGQLIQSCIGKIYRISRIYILIFNVNVSNNIFISTDEGINRIVYIEDKHIYLAYSIYLYLIYSIYKCIYGFCFCCSARYF